MSDEAPHLLLCAALLAAPSALTWLYHKAAAVLTDGMAAGATAAMAGKTSPTAVLAASAIGNSTPGANKSTTSWGTKVAVSSGDDVSRASDGQEQQKENERVVFLRMSYSVLPMVWAGILAHYEGLLLTELGLLAPRFALSMGITPDTPWLNTLPTLGPAPMPVVGAAQGLTLLLGAALSLALAGKIASVEVQHGRVQPENMQRVVMPQRVLTLSMAAELWHLIL